ncbi:MAG: SAM-dependent chlorinase/fluorinase [Deltaproteobacteria bacterium]|nr:MAG: SAM-dependent chlorinase/fluorinase [Deltaproteobacteria bacterium]
MAIITLTTDFGTADGYVGAMKGVIARLAGSPAPAVVDLAHDIPPGDIAHAAWVIATSTTEFPHGSIHVVVVDPGVGGTRREVVVRARGRWYVGPDNGVFAYVAEPSSEAYAIENERFRAERVSRTFQRAAVGAARAGDGPHRPHRSLRQPDQRLSGGRGRPVGRDRGNGPAAARDLRERPAGRAARLHRLGRHGRDRRARRPRGQAARPGARGARAPGAERVGRARPVSMSAGLAGMGVRGSCKRRRTLLDTRTTCRGDSRSLYIGNNKVAP